MSAEIRTKRRLAHELYPHGDEDQTRPLAVEVPYLADALAQGLTGDAAWAWADERNGADNGGEWAWERAVEYGVDPNLIKPYPCGPEPEHHWHPVLFNPPSDHVESRRTRVSGRESECPDCTEPVPQPEQTEPLLLDEEGSA